MNELLSSLQDLQSLIQSTHSSYLQQISNEIHNRIKTARIHQIQYSVLMNSTSSWLLQTNEKLTDLSLNHEENNLNPKEMLFLNKEHDMIQQQYQIMHQDVVERKKWMEGEKKRMDMNVMDRELEDLKMWKDVKMKVDDMKNQMQEMPLQIVNKMSQKRNVKIKLKKISD
jgi:hypothetical protein